MRLKFLKYYFFIYILIIDGYYRPLFVKNIKADT